ncbi:DegT/DnrJ/EryC1/StrS family aminotransferase [Streptomyces sp. NPDC014894]|uniref:DegT/DnrJ/EryC1/StrS family aminotransferase n=1 Tax=unclassified Streptomyces TaxID=2593676 RepID=UPI0037001988
MTDFVVPYLGQGSEFDESDIDAVTSLLRSRRHLSSGEERGAFEAEFAAAVGAEHAVATTSCTMALHLTVRLLGLRPGDEVIASPLTFQATVAPLLGREVTVRFADIDEDTLGLSPAAVEALLTPRTRAVLLTHYGGLAARPRRIAELAKAHGAALVEDCAHALGSLDEGVPLGTSGTAGCWSFHSLKNISTLGQGGMVTTGSAELARTLRRIREMDPDADFVARDGAPDFGPAPGPDAPERHAKNAYSHDCVAVRTGGLNAVMSEPAAAVGRTQLRRLPSFVARRREVADRLNARLGALPGVSVHGDLPGSAHCYHLYTFRVTGLPPGGRDELVRRLHHRYGIEIVLRYFPLHLLPEWRLRGGRYGQCPVAERVWFSELVNLPLYPSLTERQTSYMADAVERTVEDLRAGR